MPNDLVWGKSEEIDSMSESLIEGNKENGIPKYIDDSINETMLTVS